MAAALSALASDGYVEATLWTLAANALGRTFYHRGGWALDTAARPFVFGSSEVREVRYRLTIAWPEQRDFRSNPALVQPRPGLTRPRRRAPGR